MTIVTKANLQQMIDQADETKRIRIVGRALVALFQYQTAAEQRSNTTDNHNHVGFSSADAKAGSLTAKSFLAHGTLQKWQVDKWVQRDRTGFARICKYHAQLNMIAADKTARQSRLTPGQ